MRRRETAEDGSHWTVIGLAGFPIGQRADHTRIIRRRKVNLRNLNPIANFTLHCPTRALEYHSRDLLFEGTSSLHGYYADFPISTVPLRRSHKSRITRWCGEQNRTFASRSSHLSLPAVATHTEIDDAIEHTHTHTHNQNASRHVYHIPAHQITPGWPTLERAAAPSGPDFHQPRQFGLVIPRHGQHGDHLLGPRASRGPSRGCLRRLSGLLRGGRRGGCERRRVRGGGSETQGGRK